jgi:hypothetical protein
MRPLRVFFRTPGTGVRPAYRANGKWHRIARIKKNYLAPDRNFGWFRNRKGRIVVLIRHPAVLGLVRRG